MEPEIKPSSPSQNSLWPLALLGILVSVLALFTSKRNQSRKPIHPEDRTRNKDNEIQRNPALMANIAPSTPDTHGPNGSEKGTPLWEKLAVLIAFALLIANICQTRSTEKAAKAAKDSARTAYDTLQEIRAENRPWVVVKYITVAPLKPGEQAQVDIVFSNFGHSPALNTHLIGSLHITSDPTIDVPVAGVPDQITSVIVAPTMETHLALHSVDALNAQQVARAKKPDVRYYVYGTSDYQDTTTERTVHHLEYCLFATYGTNAVTPCTGKRYHNTTD